jgi:hypothetical protein
MSKQKIEGERPQKAPKTIKVKTLVIGIAIVLAIVASFMGGWFTRTADQNRVQAQAQVLFDQAQKLK